MQPDTIQNESVSIEEVQKNLNVRFSSKEKLTSKVKPNDLMVDLSYQRELVESKVNRIVKEYNSKAIGVVILSLRENGDLFIIDGAHRIAALKKMGLGNQDVNSIVYFGLSLPQEAELFVLLNENRSKPKQSAIHKASAKAGDVDSAEIEAMLSRLGLTIGDKPGVGIIRAVGLLHKVNEKISISNLEKSLRILRDAFGMHSSSFQAEFIVAISMIVVKYKTVDESRLVKTLSALGQPTYLISKASNMVGIKSALAKQIALATFVIDAYNNKLRANRLNRSLVTSADAKTYLNG
jgi:hypothetical protein